jgi:hypothetical protein
MFTIKTKELWYAAMHVLSVEVTMNIGTAGKIFVESAWAQPPVLPGLAALDHTAMTPPKMENSGLMNVTKNPVFINDNITDAIVVDLPLVPPQPHLNHGLSVARKPASVRMQFAQV